MRASLLATVAAVLLGAPGADAASLPRRQLGQSCPVRRCSTRSAPRVPAAREPRSVPCGAAARLRHRRLPRAASTSTRTTCSTTTARTPAPSRSPPGDRRLLAGRRRPARTRATRATPTTPPTWSSCASSRRATRSSTASRSARCSTTTPPWSASASTPTAAAAPRWPGRTAPASPRRASIASSPRGAPAATSPACPAARRRALPAGAVTIDRRTNQMTIRVPRSLMDPGARDLALRRRHRTLVGRRLRRSAAAHRPRTRPAPSTPRAGARDLQPRLPLRRAPAARQRRAGSRRPSRRRWPAGTTGDFHADVDFARLAARAKAPIHAPGRKQARIYASRAEAAGGRPLGLPRVRRSAPALPRLRSEDLRPHPARRRELRAALALGHLHAVRGLLAQPAAPARATTRGASTSPRSAAVRTAGSPTRPSPTSSRSGPTSPAASGSTRGEWP